MLLAIRYWLKVLRKAVSATAKLFDVKGNLLLVCGYVGITLFATYFLVTGVLTLLIIEDPIGDLRREIRLVLGFMAVLVITILLHVVYLPAKMDEEQTELIDYFEKRPTTPKLRLRAVNQKEWVGIEVFNMEDDLRISIGSGIVKDIPELDDFHSPLQLVTEQESHTSFWLQPNVWNTYLVARLPQGLGNAKIVTRYHQQDLQPGVYHLLVQIDGQAEYRDMRHLETRWRLEFEGDARSIKLEKIDEA